MSKTNLSNKRFLTPTEVANLLMVSPITVRQWAQKGLIEARTTAGGHRRFELAVVKAFAESMGIELDLDSTSDEPRILVVDDDRQLNRMLVALFSEHPEVQVEHAYDGFEAGIKIHQFRPTLVVLDIMMPGLDGIEVCKALKGNPDTRVIKVIAMTGHFTPELESKILTAGAEKLLKKPFSNQDVLAACGLEGHAINKTRDS